MSQPRRLLTLDAMRAAAAAIVIVHHATPMTTGRQLLPRGYLAVDFFFMLSGFVMTRTYDHRFAGGLEVRAFMRARLRQLYPTIAAGVILGAVVEHAQGMPFAIVVGVLARELLFVPSLGGGKDGIFRLDGVQWSLLFELFANGLHARLLYKLPTRALVGVGIGALLLLSLGTIGRYGFAVGDSGATFLAGVPRVVFAYVVGIVLARIRPFPRPVQCAGMLPVGLLVLLIVVAGWVPASRAGWLADLSLVAFVFPALIVMAVQSAATGKIGNVCAAAGALSYPLYAVHLTAIRLTLIFCNGLLPKGLPLLAISGAMGLFIGIGIQMLTRHIHAPHRIRDRATAVAFIAPTASW